jgi:uncharacterized protein YgbK (DUF1537 family)
MYLGVIADDFTGASDIANTLAKGGLATRQYFGIPKTTNEDGNWAAGVISLKSRSIDAADAVAQSLASLNWLKAQGCRQFIFKYCSTFDSTPRGNIGPVGEALARALGVKGVPACPAFPETGRTVYQGHLFVGGKPLNESGLENHPLNPMTDADIRRWLARQTTQPVGFVPWDVVHRGAPAIRSALDQAARRGEELVIVDAISDSDLIAIDEACADSPLLTGGSGIAIGLPRVLKAKGVVSARNIGFKGISGPGAVLAGSCSSMTLQQIEAYRRSHPSMPVEAGDVIHDRVNPDHVVRFVRHHWADAPLVFSSAAPEQVRQMQSTFGQEPVAHSLEQLFATVAQQLVDQGLTRLVVAGGETSGAVVTALNLDAVTVGPEIDPGVPVLTAQRSRPLALALKSGNFGGPDFFEKALRMLEQGVSAQNAS